MWPNAPTNGAKTDKLARKSFKLSLKEKVVPTESREANMTNLF